MLDSKDSKMIIDLICEKQSAMIVQNHLNYMSEEYIELEKLKIKVKNMEV